MLPIFKLCSTIPSHRVRWYSFNQTNSVMATTNYILSYCDYILRERDLALLKGRNWLNDTLIGFYFEYLSNSFGVGTKTCHFVGPEVTHLLKLMPKEQVPIVLESVVNGILSHDYTMFAVNDSDNSDESHSSGTHWSLLVYSKIDKRFVHFDSLSGSNDKDAKAIAHNLSTFTDNASFINSGYCNRQINSFDCGCHAIRTAHLISQYVNDTTEASLMDPSCPTATPMDASEMRTEFVALVLKLKQTAEPKN